MGDDAMKGGSGDLRDGGAEGELREGVVGDVTEGGSCVRKKGSI